MIVATLPAPHSSWDVDADGRVGPPGRAPGAGGVHPKREKACLVCGKLFRGRADRSYCTSPCRRRAMARAARAEIRGACAYCGEPFTGGDGRKRFCSSTCGSRAYRAARAS